MVGREGWNLRLERHRNRAKRREGTETEVSTVALEERGVARQDALHMKNNKFVSQSCLSLMMHIYLS